MNREELIKLLQSWLTTATDDNGNPLHVIMDVDIHEIATEIIKSSLPPAEGAEEILNKYVSSGVIHENNMIAAMHEFATLHAQRIAEKMMRDRLKKVESLLNSAAGLVGNPGTNFSGSCDVACDMWQKNYEAYLKSIER